MSNKYFFYFLVLGLFLLNPNLLFAQLDNENVAIINGKPISQKEIDDSIIGQLLPLQQQISVLRKVALDNLIIKTLLEEEAQKRGISVEVLRKNLTIGKIEVASSEVEKEYLENSSAFAQMNPNEAKEIIRLNLENRARIKLYREAINKLKERAKIEVKDRRIDSSIINVNMHGYSIGAKKASINVVIFSDFQCLFCREAVKINKQILQEYSDDVRLIYKHLPLREKSFLAARASYCSGEQESFWQYHDILFNSEDFSNDGLNNIAEKIGLNLTHFKNCMNSESSRQAILKDLQEAKRLGIDGTPTFIINGKMFRGAIDLKNFRQIIEGELKISQMSVEK
jgi:protein-disulfide isomerase